MLLIHGAYRSLQFRRLFADPENTNFKFDDFPESTTVWLVHC